VCWLLRFRYIKLVFYSEFSGNAEYAQLTSHSKLRNGLRYRVNCRRSTSLVLGGILPSKVKLAIAACYIRVLGGEDANGSKYWRKAFLPFSRLPIQRGTGSRACGSVGALVPVSASIPILAILAALLSGRGAPQ